MSDCEDPYTTGLPCADVSSTAVQAVLPGVAIQNLEHLAADAVDDFSLRGVQLFVQVIIAALQAARQQLALALHFGLLVVAQRARPFGHAAL